MRPPQSLTVTLGPSRRLTWLIVLWHLLAAAVAWTLPIGAGGSIGVTIASACLAVRETRRVGLRTCRSAWRALTVGEDRALRVVFADGSSADGRVAPTTYVGRSLVVLHARLHGRRTLQSTVIVGDVASGDDEFRQLRVLLRLGRDPAGA